MIHPARPTLAEVPLADLSFDDGIQKVLRGITSFDEVFRVAKKVEA